MEIELYKNYRLNISGVDIYFIPVLKQNFANGDCCAAMKYGKNDKSSFNTINTKNNLQDIEKIKLQSDLAQIIIKKLFEGEEIKNNIIYGFRNRKN